MSFTEVRPRQIHQDPIVEVSFSRKRKQTEKKEKVNKLSAFISNEKTTEHSKRRKVSYKSQNEKEADKKRTTTKTAKTFNYIYDDYTEARGEPKMLEVKCSACREWVMDYQKDGPGRLLRCYVDRIYHPSALRRDTFTAETLHEKTVLKCDNCKQVLAAPMIYKRTRPKVETRPAYKILYDGKRSSVVFNLRIT